MTDKTYTQEDVDKIVNNVRIEERYMANQLMGNLGIPANARISPDGKKIYEEAANIIMGLILAPPKKPDAEADKDVT
jgi:hypothetical protein